MHKGRFTRRGVVFEASEAVPVGVIPKLAEIFRAIVSIEPAGFLSAFLDTKCMRILDCLVVEGMLGRTSEDLYYRNRAMP